MSNSISVVYLSIAYVLLSILTTHDVRSVKETWFEYRQRQMVHLFSKASNPVMNSTQPPFQLAPMALSPGVRRSRFESHRSPRLIIADVYTSASSYVFLACQGQFQHFILPFLLHKSIDKIWEGHSVAEFSVLVRFNVGLFLIPETNWEQGTKITFARISE
jgi:hypothetical protein